ncbi:hypothetical protein Nepgr_017274 [Nepenthes gracilis]|uniref:WEB family protein n=1 Tax=Nepenthes gracilis TaxID=150966 RepID=A0AAD3XSC1_NEPGR|nr:hypothetical protein Nepgr_017274 [Nepenthes gracilis]
MAETVDYATQTYNVSEFSSEASDSKPIAEIDTSSQFGSVEEAVVRFGGRGYWIPGPLLCVTADAVEMLKDLNLKEQETLDIFDELESTRMLLEGLMLKVQSEASECRAIQQMSTAAEKNFLNSEPHDPISPNNRVDLLECRKLFPPSSAGLDGMQLKQAQINLYQSTHDLAVIRDSIESMNKKMGREKDSLEKGQERQPFNSLKETATTNKRLHEVTVKLQVTNSASGILREIRELNYEAEKFMETAEAARHEVLQAMSDIEQKKTGLKLIEMKWAAAKKLEEAARATEALALAEIRVLSTENSHKKTGRISFSLEEYSYLVNKATKADNVLKRKDFEKWEEPIREQIGETVLEDVLGRAEIANGRKDVTVAAEEALRRFGSEPGRRIPLVHNGQDTRIPNPNEFDFGINECRPILSPATSFGGLLSGKCETADDERGIERQRVSLNQMLHQYRGEASPLGKRNENNNFEVKQLPKGKTLGFVHISLPLSKQSKKKIHALNLW